MVFKSAQPALWFAFCVCNVAGAHAVQPVQQKLVAVRFAFQPKLLSVLCGDYHLIHSNRKKAASCAAGVVVTGQTNPHKAAFFQQKGASLSAALTR